MRTHPVNSQDIIVFQWTVAYKRAELDAAQENFKQNLESKNPCAINSRVSWGIRRWYHLNHRTPHSPVVTVPEDIVHTDEWQMRPVFGAGLVVIR